MTQKLDILVFGAHADDAEIGMGGTIRKHVLAGKKVGVCDLTESEMSSNGTPENRKKEAERSAAVLGLSARTCLSFPDRGLVSSEAQIKQITAQIRRYRPGIVFAPYWKDRHPDHVQCSFMVQEAVFNAKLRKFMPEMAPVLIDQLYFYFINDLDEADLMVDVSEVYEDKTASLHSYRSQFSAADAERDTVATPLNQGYLERVRARDSLLGQKKTVRYAEGFKTKSPYLINLF